MQQGNSRIIVIDDNPEIHKDFMKILNGDQVAQIDKNIDALDRQIFGQAASSTTEIQLSYQIDTALQGQEGVESVSQALKTGSRYMIAFVDVRMPPGWDGIETIKHIWEVDPDVQAVICTAYSDYSWEETVEILGLNDNLLILKKPFDATVVRQLASTLTKKWFSTQESRNQNAFLEDSIKKRTRDLQLIKATIESSSGGIMVVSNSDDILDHNQNFKEMWEIPGEIFSAKKAGMVFQYIDHLVAEPENFLEQINVLKENPTEDSYGTINLKNGKVFEYQFQPQRVNDVVVGTVWSFRDVTHRVEVENKLAFQATHDSLTKLPNRALLCDRVKQAIVSAERYGNKVALMFMSLQGLQAINDDLGHAAGDELLKAIAERLAENMRREDTLSRFGGCEFVFVARKVNYESDVNTIAERILKKFAIPFNVSDKEVQVIASIGISVYPQDSNDFPALLHNADIAMQQAKKTEGSSYQFYRQEIGKEEDDSSS